MKRIAAHFLGGSVIFSAWLAVFCLFGYRATFAILRGPMAVTLGWTNAQVSLGYSIMMLVYALTAWLSGLILDRRGPRPVYTLAAICGGLGFALTARVDSHLAYLVSFGILGGVATGMLWVSSTVTVRTWFVGSSYASRWGLAFSGAPMAQFVLSWLLKPALGTARAGLDGAVERYLQAGNWPADPSSVALAVYRPEVRADLGVATALAVLDAAWRSRMLILGIIVATALAVAVVFARRSPDVYGMRPFGDESVRSDGTVAVQARQWSIRQAFARYAIWGAIAVFLTSMMAEFLVWTQVVGFWTDDMAYSLSDATAIYAIIGLVGIPGMPLMGRLADQIVSQASTEARGRRIMLIIGPLLGVLACLLLFGSANRLVAYAACAVFALYWAVVPGGVVGYVGAIYGRQTLGRIWGLATLIVMGIGPFLGTYIGAMLRDWSGTYRFSIYYALASFLLSALLALTLPLAIGSAAHPGSSQESQS